MKRMQQKILLRNICIVWDQVKLLLPCGVWSLKQVQVQVQALVSLSLSVYHSVGMHPQAK